MTRGARLLPMFVLSCTPAAQPRATSGMPLAPRQEVAADQETVPTAPKQTLRPPDDPLFAVLSDVANGIGGDLSAWGIDAFEPKPAGAACANLRAQIGAPPTPPPASPDEAPEQTQPFEDICHEDGSGAAWGTRVTFAKGELGAYGGEFELLRFSARDSRDKAPLARAGLEHYEGLGFSDVVNNSPPVWLWFHDFDHDARPEALVLHWESVDNAHRDPKVVIWTSRSPGALRRYAPAVPYFAFAIFDLDHDGRPDLAFNPYAKSVTEPSVYVANFPRHTLVDWSLLAHALPDGTFSTNDDVATGYAKKLCPVPIRQLPQERDDWPYAIHCAKLWRSVDSKTLRHWLTEGCAKPDPTWLTPCDSSKEFYDALVDVELPLTLQETSQR